MRTLELVSAIQWAVFWALMGCVLLSALPLGARQPVSWTILALAVFLIFAVQLLLDSTQTLSEQIWGLWLPATLFLGAIAWGGAQVLPGLPGSFAHPVWESLRDTRGFISADPGQGHQVLMRYLCYVMIFWIAFRAATTSARATLMLQSIAIASSLIALYGLYTFATGHNPIVGEPEQRFVLTATFADRNTYATYAAFGVLANIAAYLHIMSETEAEDIYWETVLESAWLYALGSFLCLVVLLLTQSRAGGIAACVGLLVFLASWKGAGQKWHPWLLLTACGLVAFFAMTGSARQTSALLATEAENVRFLIYPEVIEAIADRPLLGHGLGAFHDVIQQYLPVELAEDDWAKAHNSYLENIFELGLPAAIAFYLALLVLTLRIYRGTLTRRRNRAFSAFALAVVATAATHSFFDFSLQIPAVTALFAVILALGWAQSFSLKSGEF